MCCILFCVVADVCDEIMLLLVTDSVGCEMFVADWVEVKLLLMVVFDSLIEHEELFNFPSLIMQSIQLRNELTRVNGLGIVESVWQSPRKYP
jgi:hypothetical protein